MKKELFVSYDIVLDEWSSTRKSCSTPRRKKNEIYVWKYESEKVKNWKIGIKKVSWRQVRYIIILIFKKRKKEKRWWQEWENNNNIITLLCFQIKFSKMQNKKLRKNTEKEKVYNLLLLWLPPSYFAFMKCVTQSTLLFLELVDYTVGRPKASQKVHFSRIVHNF